VSLSPPASSPHVLLHLLLQVPLLVGHHVVAERALRRRAGGVEGRRRGLVAVAGRQRGAVQARGLRGGGGEGQRRGRGGRGGRGRSGGGGGRGVVDVVVGGVVDVVVVVGRGGLGVAVWRAVVRVQPLQRLQGVEDLRFGHAGETQALQEVDLLQGVARLRLAELHPGVCGEEESKQIQGCVNKYKPTGAL